MAEGIESAMNVVARAAHHRADAFGRVSYAERASTDRHHRTTRQRHAAAGSHDLFHRRAITAGVFSAVQIVDAIISPVVGHLLDRFGPKKIAAAGCALLAAGLFLSSRIQSLWEFYLYFGLVCGLGLSSLAMVRMVESPSLAGGKILVKDAIADITLQQVLTRPDEFDVVATLNLNGDYLSDALAAQVGGIGIAPGGNINYQTGHAIFEATHGTAPKYADLDKVNPGSVILSGEMMLRHLGWTEAADLIIKGMDGAIAAKTVTYDFARLMEGATEVKCSEFGDNIIAHM